MPVVNDMAYDESYPIGKTGYTLTIIGPLWIIHTGSYEGTGESEMVSYGHYDGDIHVGYQPKWMRTTPLGLQVAVGGRCLVYRHFKDKRGGI